MAIRSEFALAFHEVLEEKQLPKDVILAAIESAMVSAYRKAVNASAAQRVEAKLDPETGKVTIYAEKEVVESVVDPRTEVQLEEARRVHPNAQTGDMVMMESTPADFGRVAAQTARQVIQQRIREAERKAQLEYFQRQIGEIVSGVVQAVHPTQGITIGLDMKAEGNMPNNQKIPGERFKVHDRVRAVVLEVKDGPRGPQIILSRAHRNFLRRLLENEVPEIYHGIVEIRAIAREPGARAKVAVSAMQPGVDAVGACVGIKGVRIQAIVKELHDEKIDIIQWDPDPVVYISKALSPARVTGVYLSKGEDGHRTATVVVSEDQLSLAIGRDGQNARLAAKLTGWRIDIKSLPEAAADALQKLRGDAELMAALPNAVSNAPLIEEILAKKAENRPVTPEEYEHLAQFVDQVERRMVQPAQLEAEDQKKTALRAEIPEAAFRMDLRDSAIKEHVVNILTEAGYETVGDLMLVLKLDPNKVLGLPGIGPRAMQNIEETLASLTFDEPAQAEAAVAEEEVSSRAAAVEVEGVSAQTVPAKAAPQVAEPIAPSAVHVQEEEQPAVKDGVSLDELFTFKPETFLGLSDEEEPEVDRKKGKKKKKKFVELEYDEELGEVIARKRHKRDDDFWDEE